MGAPFRSWLLRILVTVSGLAIVWFAASHRSSRWPVAVGAMLALVAVVVAFRRLPAFDPRGRIAWRLPSVPHAGKRCAITFDDGPTPATAAVLDLLAAEGVPATFFVLGAHVDRHAAIVQRAHAEGHAIGIHGMTHQRLGGADDVAVERQVDGTIDALRRAGVPTATVYRTPYGSKSAAVFRVARRRGLALWAWSRGVWDTDRPDASVLVRRATRFARSRMVLLLHDGRGDAAEPDVSPMLAALPSIIRELKRRGYSFVRLVDA